MNYDWKFDAREGRTFGRRDFLKASVAGAGVIATANLPVLAQEDGGQMSPTKELLLGRGDFEQLNMHYATVEIGLEKPFSVLHISDTHLTAAYDREGPDKLKAARRRTKTFGSFQEAALQASIRWARKNCDYLVHTGDLVDWQSEANTELVRKYFGPDFIATVGNHDFYTYLPGEKITKEQSFKDRSWPILAKTYPFDARFSSTVAHGVNFVCLDDTFATVQPEQVARFKAEVRKGLPIVLCMHVPFHTPATYRATMRYWRGGKFTGVVPPPAPTSDYALQQSDPVTRDFIAYLKTERQLKAILTGHEHLFAQDRFSPTAVQYVVGGNFLFAAEEILFV